MEKELQKWYTLHKFYGGYEYQTKELAEYLKVSPRTVQRWIIGKTQPNNEKQQLLKKYLAKKTRQISAKQT